MPDRDQDVISEFLVQSYENLARLDQDLGAYTEYYRLLGAHLRRDFDNPDKIREVQASLMKVFIWTSRPSAMLSS